ncbi:TPA: hypothetical protein ACHVD4_001050, partial [Streptococcus suis]
PTRYRWVDMVGTVKIGVRNYAEDYDFSRGLWEYSQGDNSPRNFNLSNGIYTLTTTTDTWHQLQIHSESGGRLGGKADSTALLEPKVGETFTLSVEVKHNSGSPNFWVEIRDNGLANYNNFVTHLYMSQTATSEWVRYSITGKWKSTADFGHRRIILGYSAVGSISFRKVELTQSSTFSDAGEAPEDRDARINSKADHTLTQQQLNALSERSQIHEAELKAKASMEALSELEKAYNSFVKANAEGQAKAEKDLAEAGRRIELLITEFGGLKELKTFIDTFMTSSNEGLIIGKNDASSTIKVSHDRISMFSAGKEVMYISQGVIHIDNGIFTASVQIGKFRTEQYHLNPDMNVIRYVG